MGCGCGLSGFGCDVYVRNCQGKDNPPFLRSAKTNLSCQKIQMPMPPHYSSCLSLARLLDFGNVTGMICGQEVYMQEL